MCRLKIVFLPTFFQIQTLDYKIHDLDYVIQALNYTIQSMNKSLGTPNDMFSPMHQVVHSYSFLSFIGEEKSL